MRGSAIKRGGLIVFEGCDKAGKSTQCRKLVEKLTELGYPSQMMRFPDRTTSIGKIIDGYLSKKEELPDEAVHLLFSANRWESQSKIRKLLLEGVTVVVDRYSFSGVAYSSAKPGMNFDWCYKPEIGLSKPDAVFLFYISSETAKKRSGFGEERYENQEFLQNVFKNYLKMKDETWQMVDGEKSIEELTEEITNHAIKTIKAVQTKDLELLQ